MVKRIFYFLFLIGYLFSYSIIDYTDVPYATKGNNSPKVFSTPLLWDSTLHVVFLKSDGIYYGKSTDFGNNWEISQIVSSSRARNPGIYLSPNRYRNLVWEEDTFNNSEIFYCCLDIRMPPINVSQTPGKSYSPSLTVDNQTSLGNVHIVFADSSFGKSRIYYRKWNFHSLSDTFQITNFDSLGLFDHTNPTIGIFDSNKIYVFWQAYSPQVPYPYRIMCRCLENDTWHQPFTILGSEEPLAHPTCDFTFNNNDEGFSIGFEDYHIGNGIPDCRFLGGNGGGYPTPDSSTYPTLSTIGGVWSYLAWMEGEREIYLHFYYFMTGWYYSGSLPRNEKVRYPSFYGANLVWTEGNIAPYKVMYHNFGYPISIKEERKKIINSNLINKNLIYDKQGRIVNISKIRKGIYFLREKDKFRKVIKF